MLIALPMLGLGLLSIYTGVRFHIYATTIFVISYFFLLYSIIEYLKIKKSFAIFLILLFTVPSLYENSKIIQYWNTQGAKPVFYPEQVKALRNLEKQVKSNDYAVTWWDFGGTLRYYTGLTTMINNATHHADNYTVANILLSDSSKFTHHATHYFYDLFEKHKSNAIYRGLQAHNDSEILFDYIEHDYVPPKKNRDKYIILPSQLAPLIYTMYVFANIDPLSGKKLTNHIFKRFRKTREDKQFVYLHDHSKIDKHTSKLSTQNKIFAIKNISLLRYKNNKKEVRHTKVSNKGLHLIVKDNEYYIMDDYFYNSIVVQMLFFNNYDKKYFSPIYEGKTISIYTVK
ncbi:Oligosaccharyltransferase PglB [hydrothermal vent metagenome]|uniref:Oligosaccharyltransferase PglB n=1 Tax=hydrothermal vent metagenome TaxID=652676 RepID=A0A1W1D0J9_9ZZZZ